MSNLSRAIVRPRFLSPDSGESLLLEDSVSDLLARGERGVIWLCGLPGGGKTTAIGHLAACFRDRDDFSAIDIPEARAASYLAWKELSRQKLVVCALLEGAIPQNVGVVWQLAQWTRDECIEYLLAARPDRCASVMSRLAAPHIAALGGNPQLCVTVLDRMAEHDDMADYAAALCAAMRDEVADDETWRKVQECCLQGSTHSLLSYFDLNSRRLSETGVLLLRHFPMRLILAVECLVDRLTRVTGDSGLSLRLPLAVILMTANRIRGREAALKTLQAALGKPAQQPMAASLLLAADPEWKPGWKRLRNLVGAHLAGADWPKTSLRKIDADDADFSRANLVGANLSYGIAKAARFREADLHGAKLNGWNATEADFTQANLTSVSACDARFAGATLQRTTLSNADLQRTLWSDATIRETLFHRARLCGAVFAGARLEDCEFHQADLFHAIFDRLDLRACSCVLLPFPWVDSCSCVGRQRQFAGEEQDSRPVIREVAEASRGRFQRLDHAIEAFRRAVADPVFEPRQ